MSLRRLSTSQRGATLIVGLIMLAVITLLVSSAFMLSSTNIKVVGNIQFRDEATAAANVALEQVITAFQGLNATPSAQTIQVNLNNDGTNFYSVAITPTCITSSVVGDGDGLGLKGDVETPGLSVGNGNIAGYITVWNIQATVSDNVTGASVVVHQGLRKLLSSNCT